MGNSSKKLLSVEELMELIHTGEAKDPLVFLESVMSGRDPRGISSIYRLVMEIDKFSGGDVSKTDWYEVVELVKNDFKYKPVTLGNSIIASKTLAEYLFPKRKQVDLSDGSGNASGNNNFLSEEEIELFKEKFNDDF